MQEFRIAIKNKKIKGYYLFAWLIVLIAYSIEIYFAFTKTGKTAEKFWIVGTLGFCLLLLLITRGLNPNKKGKQLLIVAYSFLLVPLFKWSLFWVAAILLIFIILFSIASRRFIVLVSKENIIYPSFPSQLIRWERLTNCLIKDGLLTIDFKNNQLIQQPVDESETSIDEKEFNDFCNQQLKAAASSI
ncbi:MAG TPA: hypothetical protein VIV35_09245 [Chitinophagaceae bacterium]